MVTEATDHRMTVDERRTWGRELFEDLADERCEVEPAVTRATMLGVPGLQAGGVFIASCDHRTGDLVVKLPRERAEELVDAGEAIAFESDDRSASRWVAIPSRDSRRWRELLVEAEGLGIPTGPR